jgi:cytochrome c551/c552
MGNGDFDAEPVSRAVLDRQPDAQVVMPPQMNLVCSDAGDIQKISIFKPLSNMGASPGNKRQAIWLAQFCLACHATL